MHGLWARLHEPPGFAIRGSAGLWLLAVAVGGLFYLAGAREVGIAIVALACFAGAVAIGGAIVLATLSVEGWQGRLLSLGVILLFGGELSMVTVWGLYAAMGGDPSIAPSDPIYPVIFGLGAGVGGVGMLAIWLSGTATLWRSGDPPRSLMWLAIGAATVAALVAYHR